MTFFRNALETMPREQLPLRQLERFRSLIDRVLPENRFYRKKWAAAGAVPADIATFADFAALPFTAKTELFVAQEEAPPLGTNATFPEKAYTRLHQTSGTTGVPLRVLDTEESWDWWGECWGYVFSGAGVTCADRIFLPFSFGPFIGFWAAVEGARKIGALMIPGGGLDSLQRLHRIRELGATVVCCTPTYALRLAQVAGENNLDLRSMPVRVLILAGEPGANIPETKARIESAWHAKCFDHAGASEVGAHSFECEIQPGGIHINEIEFIAEVLDAETGRRVSDGEIGELVITNLGRAGFPAIRYRTGDLVRWNPAPCACGRTFARFDGGLIGRTDDMITIRGVNIYPSAIENVVRRFSEVTEFLVTVSKAREMQLLEIQIEVGTGEGEGLRREVELALHRALSLRPVVRLAQSGSLPRSELKARRFRRIDDTTPDPSGRNQPL